MKNFSKIYNKRILNKKQYIEKHSLYSWGIKDFLQTKAIYIMKGEGPYFWDDNGKKYIDFSGQAVCSNLGHSCSQEVIKAVTDQMLQMPFMFGDTLVSEIRAKYSKKLADYTPGDINSFLFLCSGAEANEQAIRICQRITGRQKIFSAHRSYHGGTTATLNLTGDSRKHFTSSLPNVHKFLDPNPYIFSWGDSVEEIVKRSLYSLRQQIICENSNQIAAIILESLCGTNGFITYPKGYMEGVRELCDEFGILLICDEVMTGFGRTGKKFGFQNFNILPDIITCAKGITSAYMPLSAIGLRDHVHDKIRKIPLGGGSTYVAHPVTLGCANKILDIISHHKFLDHVNSMGKIMKIYMEKLHEKYPDIIKNVRTIGLFGAIELSDQNSSHGYLGLQQVPDPKMIKFRFELMEKGLFTFTNGSPHIAITPPLIINADQIAEGISIIDETIANIF